MLNREDAAMRYIPISDGALVQHCLDGNQLAFEELVHRYSGDLFRFILPYVGDNDQAYDILQSVFLQLYVSLSTLRMNTSLKPWLFQVARNRCIDELRHKPVVHFSELELGTNEDEGAPLFALPDSAPLPEEVAECHDLQHCLQQAVQALPPKYRAIVLLRYASQLSFAEIGQVLAMPEATAKTYFQRAKSLLRRSLVHDPRVVTDKP